MVWCQGARNIGLSNRNLKSRRTDEHDGNGATIRSRNASRAKKWSLSRVASRTRISAVIFSSVMSSRQTVVNNVDICHSDDIKLTRRVSAVQPSFRPITPTKNDWFLSVPGVHRERSSAVFCPQIYADRSPCSAYSR